MNPVDHPYGGGEGRQGRGRAARRVPGTAGRVLMYDEILEACARDELRDLGMDEDSVGEALATMRDQGMFDVPEWAQ